MVDVRFTLTFKRRLKELRKRYRWIQSDLQPAINEFEKGNLVGDQVSSTTATIFKVRVARTFSRGRAESIAKQVTARIF